MTESRYKPCCLGLRIKCFIVAYLNLFACIVDIFIHLLVVAITTRGFQCDVSINSLNAVNWPWLEPFLFMVNIGTHGFYPLPLTYKMHTFLGFPVPSTMQDDCYPGMFHVSIIDMFNFMINLIWLHFDKAFLRGVHKKDTEPMRMFFGIGVLKLILQIVYFDYQPGFSYINDVQLIMFVKLIDVCMSAFCLFIIYEYIKVLVDEKRREAVRVIDQPPSYIECLVESPNPVKEVKKEPIVDQPSQSDTATV